MIIPTPSSLDCPGKLNKTYIQKHYPEFYAYIESEYSDYKYNKFSELMYAYFHGIVAHPVCPICGRPVPFLDFGKGYQKFCSRQCAAQSDETKSTYTKTIREKYGVDRPSQNANIKNKIISTYTANNGGMGNASKSVKEKMYKTMEEKYGVMHARWVDEFNEAAQSKCNEKIATTIAKTRSTMVEKYGCWASMSDLVKEKIRETMEHRYGGSGAASEEILTKILASRKNITMSKYPDIIDINSDGLWVCKCPHTNCTKCKDKQYVIPGKRYIGRLKDHTELCTNILPVKDSIIAGTTLELFVRSVLDEHGVDYICNDRTILNGQELDIYIPDRHIAIECNGIYWHSKKSTTYHADKYIKCAQKNIQLITLWEDWIINKPEIVESLLITKLGLNNNRVYARKCTVKEITPKISKDFLNNNHIQGSTNAHKHIGMFYNDELVAVMTFSKHRGCMGRSGVHDANEWELSRFCSKLNTRVVGGCGKMLAYFISKYNPCVIYSFSSHDISDGNLYKSLGFERDRDNVSYWYVDSSYKRYHRSAFTKQSIVKRGWKENKDGWKEVDVMREHGYHRIYDSGQTKWVMRLK